MDDGQQCAYACYAAARHDFARLYVPAPTADGCGLLVTSAAAFVTATTTAVCGQLPHLLFTIAELALVKPKPEPRVQNMLLCPRRVLLVYALLNGMVLSYYFISVPGEQHAWCRPSHA